MERNKLTIVLVKGKKMKKGHIKYRNSSQPKWTYISTHPVFCWLAPIDTEKKMFDQVTGWHGCRETFVSELKKSLVRAAKKETTTIPTIPTDRLRIGVMTRIHSGYTFRKDSVKEKATALQDLCMTGAVRILNVVERHLNWSLTKMYKDDSTAATQEEVKANVYIFVSSPKWLRAPQLLSLYLLLIRIASIRSFHKVKTLEELIGKMREANKKKVSKNEKIAMYDEDTAQAERVSVVLKDIFDKLDKLFFSRTIYQNYRHQNGCYGIFSLVEGRGYGGDDYITIRYNTLVRRKEALRNYHLKKKATS